MLYSVLAVGRSCLNNDSSKVLDAKVYYKVAAGLTWDVISGPPSITKIQVRCFGFDFLRVRINFDQALLTMIKDLL